MIYGKDRVRRTNDTPSQSMKSSNCLSFSPSPNDHYQKTSTCLPIYLPLSILSADFSLTRPPALASANSLVSRWTFWVSFFSTTSASRSSFVSQARWGRNLKPGLLGLAEWMSGATLWATEVSMLRERELRWFGRFKGQSYCVWFSVSIVVCACVCGHEGFGSIWDV